MHRQRILTALFAAPVLAAAIFWGGAGLFSCIVLLMSAGCLYEYYRAVFQGGTAVAACGIVAGLLPVASLVAWHDATFVLPALYLVFLASIIFFLLTYSMWENCLQSWALFVLGSLYIGICALHLILVRRLDNGVAWTMFLAVVIFSGDSGAYYIGRAMGRKKLCPSISGGKTVAGAVGGLLLNIFAGLVMWFVMLRQVDPRFIVPLVLLLGVTGQFGDLAESVIKRAAGVKDSGHVLPGHGGLFDRVDALLLAAPMLYWILVLVAHFRLFGLNERLIYYAS